MKIVNPDYMWFAPEHIVELNKLGDFVRYENNPSDNKETISRIGDAEIVVDFWQPLPKDTLLKLPNLKMICIAASGYDWVDLKTATERNIVVSNCPGHNAEAVAEHTIGLMICAARNSFKAAASFQKGEWKPDAFKGIDLKAKTLGIIGYGRIGKRVGEIASKGLGMKILWTNSESNRSELEKLLKNSDVISVNTPLTDKTKNLISDKEFKLMKKGVVIVNTGRGAVINKKSLVKYLKNGKIRSAGIDTYEFEPPKKTPPTTKLHNVIATPHISWDTEETDYYLSQMVVDNVKAFIRGKPINVVN